jgi:prevent-host-death family protein
MEYSYNVGAAKNNLSKLLKLVRSGQKVTITNRGKPVAELAPVRRKRQFGTMPELLADLPAGWEEAVKKDEAWLKDFDFIRDEDAREAARTAGRKTYRMADGSFARVEDGAIVRWGDGQPRMKRVARKRAQ